MREGEERKKQRKKGVSHKVMGGKVSWRIVMLGIRMRNDSWRRTSREVLATSGIRWPRSSLKYFLNPQRTRGYGRDSLNNGRQRLGLRKKV